MTIHIIDCPSEVPISKNYPSVFLAGGISNCANWQSEITQLLSYAIPSGKSVTVVNPRKKDYIHTKEALNFQIRWEYERLLKCDIIAFYFRKETVCPITLFELGKALGRKQHVIVASDPEYSRLEDLHVQLELEGYKNPMLYTLQDLTNAIAKVV